MCENCTVKMDRCLLSRSASTAQDEDAASVTSDSATQESTLSSEPVLNARNTETNTEEGVDLLKNSKVTSNRDQSPVLVHQLQSNVCFIYDSYAVGKRKIGFQFRI